MQAQWAWFLGTEHIRKLVLEGPAGQGSRTRSWRALCSEAWALGVRRRQPRPDSCSLPVHLHRKGELALTHGDGTAGEAGCAPGVGLAAALAGVLRGPHGGLPRFCPTSAPRLRLPASSGMELSVFSIPCLFINVNCNYIISWYASRFHAMSDLQLIRKVTTAGPNRTISALTLPSAGSCGRTHRASPRCWQQHRTGPQQAAYGSSGSPFASPPPLHNAEELLPV